MSMLLLLLVNATVTIDVCEGSGEKIILGHLPSFDVLMKVLERAFVAMNHESC